MLRIRRTIKEKEDPLKKHIKVSWVKNYKYIYIYI